MRLAHRALAGLLATLALPAQAHLMQTGFGGFYDGLIHLFMSFTDLLLAFALALLAGLRGRAAARFTVIALPAAWFIGGLIGQHWTAVARLDPLLALPFALAGALVALDARVPMAWLRGLVLAAGFIHGLANGATMDPERASVLALVGVVSGVIAIVLLLAAETSQVREGWPRIVVRVLGSWVTATGMLMFGWILHTVP